MYIPSIGARDKRLKSFLDMGILRGEGVLDFIQNGSRESG